MYKVEGFWNVVPKIKKVSFPVRGKMSVFLNDGRTIIVPISAFPSIKKSASFGTFQMVSYRRRYYMGFLS